MLAGTDKCPVRARARPGSDPSHQQEPKTSLSGSPMFQWGRQGGQDVTDKGPRAPGAGSARRTCDSTCPGGDGDGWVSAGSPGRKQLWEAGRRWGCDHLHSPPSAGENPGRGLCRHVEPQWLRPSPAPGPDGPRWSVTAPFLTCSNPVATRGDSWRARRLRAPLRGGCVPVAGPGGRDGDF